MKKYFLLIVSLCAFFSCEMTSKEPINDQNSVKKQENLTNLRSVEMEIKGMTCEIGCARTIESKLSKVDGVTFSKIDFNAAIARITYDSNKISKEEIIKKINGIAGGGLYYVTNSTDIEKIFKISD